MYLPADSRLSGFCEAAADAVRLHQLFMDAAPDNSAAVNCKEVIGPAFAVASSGKMEFVNFRLLVLSQKSKKRPKIRSLSNAFRHAGRHETGMKRGKKIFLAFQEETEYNTLRNGDIAQLGERRVRNA